MRSGSAAIGSQTTAASYGIGPRQGTGVSIRVDWDIQRELQAGELETVLDEFVPDNANLYAVTASEISSPRVRAFIDYLVEEFLKPERPVGAKDLT